MVWTKLPAFAAAGILVVATASPLEAQSTSLDPGRPLATNSSASTTTAPTVEVLGISRRDQPEKWWNAQGESIASPVEVDPAVHGFLGIGMSDVEASSDAHRESGYTGGNCVVIQNVLPNSPAAGKLKAGDLITHINENPASNISVVQQSIGSAAPGTPMKFRIFRDKKSEELTITLAERPKQLPMRRAPNRESFRVLLRISPWTTGTDVTASTVPDFPLDFVNEASTTPGKGRLELMPLTPRGVHRMDIKIGFGRGVWSTLAQSSNPQEEAVKQLLDGGSVTIHAASDSITTSKRMVIVPLKPPAGAAAAAAPATRSAPAATMRVGPSGTFVQVTRTLQPGAEAYDARLIALLDQKEVTAIHLGPIADRSQRIDTFHFPGVQPDEIVGMLFQTRGYDWTTVRDVAMEPKNAP